MASNRQAESLCWICILTAAFLLPPATFCSADDRKLPSARELIRETQSLYTGDEKPDSWVLLELARALAHLGDLKAARDLLAPPKLDSLFDDSLIASGYLTIAEIEIATTGSTASLPDFLNRDLKGHNHLVLAEAYARHGYVDKALAQVNSLPANDNFSLRFSGHRVVESLHAVGHRDAAREVLVHWTKCYSNSKDTFDYFDCFRFVVYGCSREASSYVVSSGTSVRVGCGRVGFLVRVGYGPGRRSRWPDRGCGRCPRESAGA